MCAPYQYLLLFCCEFESRLGEAYSIHHYGIKFVSDLRQVFSGYSWFRHDITEILLKVALNTITLTPHTCLM